MRVDSRRLSEMRMPALGRACRTLERPDGREPYGGDAGNPRAKRKKKVFSKTDGEYVEFEEISCDTASRRTETSAADGSTTFVREEQVSDAEWTEIK